MFRAVVTGRINVINVAPRCRLWLEARPNRDDVLRVALYSVRIGQHKTAFIFGVRFQIEDAAREHSRNDILKRVFVDALVAEPKQRKPFLPRLVASFAIGDRDRSVAVVVAIDAPLKAERDKGGRLNVKIFREDFIRGGRHSRPEESEQQNTVGASDRTDHWGSLPKGEFQRSF